MRYTQNLTWNLFIQVGDYKCECDAGWTGRNCDVEINECEPSPCKNNATCTDKVNGFMCDCISGYTGKLQLYNDPVCNP